MAGSAVGPLPSTEERQERDDRVSLLEAICIALAGVAAGAINTIVGSGSLVSFPVLLAFGYSPVVANVTNTVGLVPGSVTGALGYRAELSGQRGRIVRMGIGPSLGR